MRSHAGNYISRGAADEAEGGTIEWVGRNTPKKKHFSPLYLLHGDEPFYIDKVSDFIEDNALSPADRSFNQFVFFGKDLTIPALLSHAKRFPMMADRQLILVKEAQQLQGLDQKEMQVALENYTKNPLSSTILN